MTNSPSHPEPDAAPARPVQRRQPRGLHPAALVLLYLALAFLPLLLALVQGRPGRGFFREFSSGLVMVGYAMMLMQFVLSGRFPAISGRMGIDLTMRFHQLVAWAVLVFILVHPLLYAAPRLSPEPADAWAMLTRMFGSEGLRSGVIAWWLLLALVPIAAFKDRMPFGYEVWRLSHGLGAVAIALLGTHHTLRVGTYSADRLLTWFWILLTAIAVLTLVWVYLVKPLLKRRRPYRVVANERVADRMWEVTVEPETGTGTAMDFAAGQFVWLNLGHSPFSPIEHPFSISSAPGARPHISFTIKESGDFTDKVGTIPVGTRAWLDGPHGAFTLPRDDGGDSGYVFVAGGVGFAPIIGLLRQLADERHTGPLMLIYGNRVETQILYRDEIEALRNRLDLSVHLVLSEPPPDWNGSTGELTRDMLRGCLDMSDRATRRYYVCGPPAMLDAVERSLVDLGIPGRQIVSERFRY